MAEEDAVGRRDGLAAQGQRTGPVEAVGQQRQALAQRARGAAPGRRRDDRDDPQLGELERQLAVDPALLQCRVRAGHGPLLIPRDSRSSAVRRRSSSALVELADARGLHHTACQRVGELRADGDAEQARQAPVEVPRHREAPAMAAHERAQVAALAADRDRRHLEPRVARQHALEQIELARALLAARGQEGEHERPALAELARVEDPRAAHGARRALAGRALVGLARDVDRRVERSERERRGEGRHLGAHLQAALRSRGLGAQRVQRHVAHEDHAHERDEPPVAAGAGGRRGPGALTPSARAAR